jgi:hypothetical protein
MTVFVTKNGKLILRNGKLLVGDPSCCCDLPCFTVVCRDGQCIDCGNPEENTDNFCQNLYCRNVQYDDSSKEFCDNSACPENPETDQCVLYCGPTLQDALDFCSDSCGTTTTTTTTTTTPEPYYCVEEGTTTTPEPYVCIS